MNLKDLTIKQINQIKAMFGGDGKLDHPFEIGEKYLIRTVTMIHTGQIKEIRGKFIVLQDADWIADTGRFSTALEDQDNFNEVEPFKNDAIVNMDTIVDATKIAKLIRKLK